MNRLALTYPVILLGMVVGSEGVGNYRLAELFYSFLAQFGHLFASAGFSHLSYTFQHRRSETPAAFGRMLAWMSAGALLAGLSLSALGPAVFGMAFGGSAARETLVVLEILGVALVFAAPVRFLKGLLASVDRQDMVLVVNFVAVIMGFGMGWVASSRWGIIGMAGAVVVTELVTACLLLTVYVRTLHLRVPGLRRRSRG